ncbi:MAG: helix-hairpin-helix domain-containing protein [Bacteroidales bacterium]|nr:helix-hairpin-helix domain-containing protein [Bacteroidales bacterium]
MHFHRTDRRALLYLITIIVALWGGVLIERYVLHPGSSSALMTLDEAAMDTLDASQGRGRDDASPSFLLARNGANGGQASASSGVSGSSASSVTVTTPETFPFDPNTADSLTLRRLGLAEWQVRNILKYRARGGRYHEPSDFKRVYGMTPEVYERLAPVIRIDKRYRYYGEADFEEDKARRKARREGGAEAREQREGASRSDSAVQRFPHQEKFREVVQLDLNTIDTATLKKVPGIASGRARQIIRYRERLGGFASTEQLAEISNFPAAELEEWFKVETGVTRRLNINSASVKELARHPYIGLARARAIDDYRHQQGRIRSLDDLQLLPGFDAEVIRKLRPYIEY